MDDFDPREPLYPPTAKRPLLGLTILVIEDSRFASETMRLMCLRSGARIRRADSLRTARRHLQVYRPSALVVDLGLPDGSGLDLIAELNRATPRIGVLIAISGDDIMREAALAAGADAFLAKPLASLGVFQHAMLAHLPRERQPNQPCAISAETVRPDPMAFRDDMAHVATILDDDSDGTSLRYVAQFLRSVARDTADLPLEEAAISLDRHCVNGAGNPAILEDLAGMVQARITDKIAI